MKAEFEKKMRIASDLLSYCHLKGAEEFHLDIASKDGLSVFTIKAGPVSIAHDEMESLRKNLNAPRQREIEQNYWELSGESESFAELMLVGMMSDEAEVECEDGILSITIKRLH